jgi:proline iminopeptidase
MNSVLILIISCILILFNSVGLAQDLKSFQNGSFTLYYEEFGSGPPLYVLSGGPGEAPDHPYRWMIDSLKSYYTCILLHQRASGASRNIPVNPQTISIEQYTSDIERLRQVRGDAKVSLAGMSWVGLLVMNYAALYPKQVENLILICSAPPSYTLWHFLYDNQYVRHSPAERDEMNELQKLFSVKTDRELDSLKRSDPENPIVIAYKKYMRLHVNAMYYDSRNISEEQFNQLFLDFNFQPIPIIDREVLETKWNITEKLKKVKAKTLIVYGRQDDQGESTFYLQKESLRNSEMKVIEQCGHEILEEQPEAFFKILMDFVRRSRQGRG